MIFSIFGKKDKAPARRGGSEVVTRPGDRNTAPGAGTNTGPGTGPATGNGPAAGSGAPSSARTASNSTVDQREIARLTAEKIDLIESQMERAASARGYKADPALRLRPDGSPSAMDEPGAASVPGLSGTSSGSRRANAAASMNLVLLPVFEEASLLFSNGQINEAAMMLWQAIKDDQLGDPSWQAWKMLFDLYQASGRRPEFESLAIVYASQSESSPPTWSDELGPPAAKPVQALPASAIVFAARLDAQSAKQVEQMQRAAQRDRPADVDFSKVRSVDDAGAGLLLPVLVDFRKRSRRLTVSGLEELATAVSAQIENGRRDATEVCWLLKLEALRLLDQQQAFEDLAIDYCVTYEVSPPSWEALPDSIRSNRQAPAPAPVSEAPARSAADEAFALEGEIDGRPDATLKALRDYAQPHSQVVIDCRRLRRMDFACAGEMLNEANALRSAGKSVVFKDLTSLVACLMMVMGIHEVAELRLRIR